MQEPGERPVAVVTGAGRGIGAATARLLAGRGWAVALLARSGGPLQALARELEAAGGRALALPCDVTDPAQVRSAFARVRAELGPVGALVNNAATLVVKPFLEQTAEEWQTQWEVNLHAPARCAREALRDMVPRLRGVIVNVASVAGVAGVDKLPGLVGYAATKGALLTWSEALGAELAPQGIRVVSVSPGSVRTEMLAAAAPGLLDQAMAPEAVAEVIAFLVSEAGAAVQRTNVTVWGPPG